MANPTLPNKLWESPVIKRRLAMESAFECNAGISAKKHYWVVVPQADTRKGCVTLKNFDVNIENVEPHEAQKEFAEDIQNILQQEASFDGLWVVGYTHPPSTYHALTDSQNCWDRLIMIWHDKDGDPQYTLESDRPFISLVNDGPEYWVEQAHVAHKSFLPIYGDDAMKSDMKLTEAQQKKAALDALN